MKFFKSLLTLSCILPLLSLNNTHAQSSAPLIRFGLIADIQYCNCDTERSRFYRNSLSKLEECVSDLNKENVQFTINLGDLIDRHQADLDSVLTRLKHLNHKLYNTTGNHDYKEVTDDKLLYKKLNMPSEYYSFRKKGWLFIVLNTNEVSMYANIAKTGKEKELKDMQEQIKISGRKNGARWNGGISNNQMQWLKKLLATAQKKGEKVLVFSHHPLYPETEFVALNSREILETLSSYSCVKGVLSGHHHVGGFGEFKGIPLIIVEGMVETEKNAYGVVDIYPDKIVLNGKGRVESREIKLAN